MSNNTINLKKAHAYETELDAILNTVSMLNMVDCSVYQKYVDAFLSGEKSKLNDKLIRRKLALQTKYAIRKLVDDANHTSGISSQLTFLAYVQRQITTIEGFLRTVPDVIDVDIFKNKLNYLLHTEDRQSDVVKVPLMDIASDVVIEMQNELIQLKKTRSDVKDFISAANINTTIVLPADVMEVLTIENII